MEQLSIQLGVYAETWADWMIKCDMIASAKRYICSEEARVKPLDSVHFQLARATGAPAFRWSRARSVMIDATVSNSRVNCSISACGVADSFECTCAWQARSGAALDHASDTCSRDTDDSKQVSVHSERQMY